MSCICHSEPVTGYSLSACQLLTDACIFKVEKAVFHTSDATYKQQKETDKKISLTSTVQGKITVLQRIAGK